MTLREFIHDRKTGRPKRGAISRVSEHLGVSYNTVARWYSGDWKPGTDTARMIQNMIHARISLKARSCAPNKKRLSQNNPLRRTFLQSKG